MKARFVLSAVVAVGFSAFALPGYAQQTSKNPDVLPADNTGNGANPSGPSGPSDAPAPPADATPKPVKDVGGYAYNDKPVAGSAPRVRYKQTGATVALPGFEQSADGGTRFFVQLSQTVPVEERKANGTITYIMKGASPRVWNNTNALVTVHFNTPVSRARLVPKGHDLLFILDLRAAATPTYKIVDTADKGAQLTIDFPKGDWLNAPALVQTTETVAPRTTTKKKKK